MFEQLLSIIQSNGQESVINNPAVPNEHNEGVMQAASSSIMDTIKGMMANGQGSQVAQLANDPNSPAAQVMQNGFVEKIMQQFGINGDAAKGIAGSLIPMVMAQLNKGGNGQGGGLDLSSLSGMLGKTGLDKDGDGDVDLKDVTKMFGF